MDIVHTKSGTFSKKLLFYFFRMAGRKGKDSDPQSIEKISSKHIQKILFDDETKEPKRKEPKDEKKKSKSTRLTTSPTSGSGPSKTRKIIEAPSKEKPKINPTPLDATGIVKLNKNKKGTLEIDTKAIAEENKRRKDKEGLLEEQIVALRAELEKSKNTGSQPITPSPVPASPDHTGLGDFSKSQIDFMQTLFGNQLKMYHEAQAAIEKLKLKKATSDLKAPGRKTAAANKATRAEKSSSNSSLGDVMGSFLSDGDGTDDEEMGGSKDDQDGDDSE